VGGETTQRFSGKERFLARIKESSLQIRKISSMQTDYITIITMKFFAFAASSIIVFAASVVVKVAADQSNVIALLRGGGGGSKSTLTINTEAEQLGGRVVVGTSFPGQSIVCTTSIPDVACYPNTPQPGWPECCSSNVVCPTIPHCQTLACSATGGGGADYDTDAAVVVTTNSSSGTTPFNSEKGSNSWCSMAQQVCCRRYTMWHSFCSYYGLSIPVASDGALLSVVSANDDVEEEMMVMQEKEGNTMTAADDYSTVYIIDCTICGNGPCV